MWKIKHTNNQCVVPFLYIELTFAYGFATVIVCVWKYFEREETVIVSAEADLFDLNISSTLRSVGIAVRI